MSTLPARFQVVASACVSCRRSLLQVSLRDSENYIVCTALDLRLTTVFVSAVLVTTRTAPMPPPPPSYLGFPQPSILLELWEMLPTRWCYDCCAGSTQCNPPQRFLRCMCQPSIAPLAMDNLLMSTVLDGVCRCNPFSVEKGHKIINAPAKQRESVNTSGQLLGSPKIAFVAVSVQAWETGREPAFGCATYSPQYCSSFRLN